MLTPCQKGKLEQTQSTDVMNTLNGENDHPDVLLDTRVIYATENQNSL